LRHQDRFLNHLLLLPGAKHFNSFVVRISRTFTLRFLRSVHFLYWREPRWKNERPLFQNGQIPSVLPNKLKAVESVTRLCCNVWGLWRPLATDSGGAIGEDF
jgi:hypothetical protein